LPSPDGPLACPRCGRPHPEEARICFECRMPLLIAGGNEQPARGEAHEQARKIHPRYARGELRRVAVGRNLAEAELIKGVLLEQGIPSMLRRTGGFDVPDFLAAGPRDVLVPDSGVEAARDLLSEIDPPSADAGGGPEPDGARARSLELRLAAGLLIALLLFTAIAGAGWILIR
jgi:hypothetical protein